MTESEALFNEWSFCREWWGDVVEYRDSPTYSGLEAIRESDWCFMATDDNNERHRLHPQTALALIRDAVTQELHERYGMCLQRCMDGNRQWRWLLIDCEGEQVAPDIYPATYTAALRAAAEMVLGQGGSDEG